MEGLQATLPIHFWRLSQEESEEEKCNYLMLCVGDKGREIYSAWELRAEKAKKIDTDYTKNMGSSN